MFIRKSYFTGILSISKVNCQYIFHNKLALRVVRVHVCILCMAFANETTNEHSTTSTNAQYLPCVCDRCVCDAFWSVLHLGFWGYTHCGWHVFTHFLFGAKPSLDSPRKIKYLLWIEFRCSIMWICICFEYGVRAEIFSLQFPCSTL